MILDALIALVASIVALIMDVVLTLLFSVFNFGAVVIEGIVGLFGASLQLSRIRQRERKSSLAMMIPAMILVLGLLGWLGWSKLLHRDHTLVAEDGHSLPFAAVVIHKGDEDLHRRTDHSGHIRTPRFGITGITLKDPRYVVHTWKTPDIPQTFVARRTILGGGLDKVANRLLQPLKQ